MASDLRVIEEKIESLRKCLERIREKTPSDAETLAHDIDRQDIIALNFERAVQICVDIAAHTVTSKGKSSGTTMGAVFDELAALEVITKPLATEMRKVVGLRNLMVHRYATIDWGKVYILITKRLSVFSRFAQSFV